MLQIIVVTVLLVLLGVMAMQLFRYLYLRRNSAQDRQRILPSPEAFHVITFFQVAGGSKVVDSARLFCEQVTKNSNARLIYAGQAGFSTVPSRYLPSTHWDGVILFEYPTRLDYEEAKAELGSLTARAIFADSYIHGMRRNWRLSTRIPLFLLKLRLKNIVTGRSTPEPFQPPPDFGASPRFEPWRTRARRMRSLHNINRRALVIFNLVKRVSLEQQLGEDSYNMKMLSRMATLGHGPLHIGRTVALEGNARFNSVYIVHFPSAGYVADLISSQFFHGILSRVKLADSMAVPTVPITDLL